MKLLRVVAFLALLGPSLAAAAEALPLAVGHRAVTYVDPLRGNRQVPTEIYYPADAAGDNVPVAAGDFPVVTFGHGFLMVWSSYQYLWSALVPRGYIVALPRTEGGISPSHEQFGRDLAFLVDKLRAEGASPASPFYNHVAATACVMGHSMGGGSSVLAASYNPGITALANLAAAETNPSAIGAAANVGVPSLVFAGSEDCVTPPSQHQIPIYNALATDCKTLVTITGGSHCQFADSNFYCELGESCNADITREQQHALVEALLFPWLDWTLRGDSAGLRQFQDLLDGGAGTTFLQDCPLVSGLADSDAPTGVILTAHPNPFTGSTWIRVDRSETSSVRAEIYDVSGRMVRSLAGGSSTGPLVLSWNGRGDRGEELPSGTYYCRVRADGRTALRPLVLLR